MAIKSTFLPLFDLHHDQADSAVIEQAIHQGVRVGGTNLWVLIFAILIASIGLNVNSTAVIIGAMLISPLMGPIIAIGYGVATNDSDLIRKAMRNLALFVAISLLTSFLYFKLSPLSLAHSELLARTTPTLWDVLIAFFGGAAGIVALTRRQPSLALSGVAIATALMPPLCTAGYGLAVGNFAFFGGAFYLFAINSVFISLSTALFVKLMKLPQHPHATPELQNRTRIWMSLALVVMIFPSSWLAYRLVKEELFVKAANEVLNTTNVNSGFFELSRQVDPKHKKIILTIGGDLPPKDLKEHIQQGMKLSGFGQFTVEVRYLGTANLANEMNQDIQELYAKAMLQLENNNQTLRAISVENQRLKEAVSDRSSLIQEILAQYSMVYSVVIVDGKEVIRAENLQRDIVLVTLFIKKDSKLLTTDKQRIESWLATRFKDSRFVVVVSKLPLMANHVLVEKK